MSGKVGVKLVSAGGLRAPLSELIERLAMFGFPPATDPGYAVAIDRECEKLIRKFEDADEIIQTIERMADFAEGIFLGQDVTGQVPPLEVDAQDPCPTCGWDRALTNKDVVHECLPPDVQAWVRRGA